MVRDFATIEEPLNLGKNLPHPLVRSISYPDGWSWYPSHFLSCFEPMPFWTRSSDNIGASLAFIDFGAKLLQKILLTQLPRKRRTALPGCLPSRLDAHSSSSFSFFATDEDHGYQQTHGCKGLSIPNSLETSFIFLSKLPLEKQRNQCLHKKKMGPSAQIESLTAWDVHNIHSGRLFVYVFVMTPSSGWTCPIKRKRHFGLRRRVKN